MEQSLVADDGQEAAAPVEVAPVVEAMLVVAVVRCRHGFVALGGLSQRQPTKGCDFLRRWLDCGSSDFSVRRMRPLMDAISVDV